MKIFHLLILFICIFSCSKQQTKTPNIKPGYTIDATSIVILGTIQDAGSPHIGCSKSCCAGLFDNPNINRKVSSLGLVDSQTNKTYLFDATPDITSQIQWLTDSEPNSEKQLVDGIFLTHAHIGHYTGLMYLGKEAIDAKKTPVYVMPRMKKFLESNGPWEQLVNRKNILLKTLTPDVPVTLSQSLEVTPVQVPHRDEYSETVGYKIKGPNKTALYIPDIDKWEKWEKNIIEEIKKVDYAFLDATFYSGLEMNRRDISQIPHPLIIESLERFKALEPKEKSKVVFIHFNHTNPILNPNSAATRTVRSQGYNIARIHDIYEL
ncbi:MBL fold metallo-hydrolase [Formosa sediminum]|uniref:MBL fold metallo-hydrolase n=1 Tax=Formosa sediminum TaxID=2594004 RepID=A0A516GSX3_9FLAO|nr:MBL fold metallo-hydrolase [Formosa sediminum]QDO94605.1 MBL fold metallo-hydrolase [Formosa sediminum]